MVIDLDVDWDVDMSGLEELEREMQWLETQVIEYGYLEPTKMHPKAKVPIAQIAFWNNYGTKSKGGKKWHIPPRPFFDLAELFVEDLLTTKFAKRLSQSFLEGKVSYSKALDYMAKESADQVVFAIDEGDYMALDSSTIRRKGSDTILIETGTMIGSVTGVVKRDDGSTGDM